MVTKDDIGKKCLLRLEVVVNGRPQWRWERVDAWIIDVIIQYQAVHIKLKDGSIFRVKIEHVRALDPIHY